MENIAKYILNQHPTMIRAVYSISYLLGSHFGQAAVLVDICSQIQPSTS